MLLRYLDWLGHALTGNLGYSFSTHEPVTSMILESLAPTLTLIMVSASILLPFGFLIGYYIGIHPLSRLSRVVRGFAQVMTSMPEYWIAILFNLLFRCSMAPCRGSDSWRHFLLPIIRLS